MEKFGEGMTSREEYYPLMKRFYEHFYPDWKVVQVETFSNSSMVLFEKTEENRPCVVNYHKTCGNAITIRK